MPPVITQTLAVEEWLVITDGVATTIRIYRGEVCITEDASFIDHVLTAGQHYTFDRSGRAIVVARSESRIGLDTPRIGVPPRSVERCKPRWPSNDMLYVRPPLLNAVVGLIPLWVRRQGVSPAR
jgi:hypothetical protein